MKSISAVLLLFVFSSVDMGQTTVQVSSDSTTEQELIRIAQEPLDAIAVGDKAVWEKYVADDVIYTDENWRVLTKKELLPADENTFYPTGTIRGEKVFVRDASGRVTHLLDRRENNDLVWKRVK